MWPHLAWACTAGNSTETVVAMVSFPSCVFPASIVAVRGYLCASNTPLGHGTDSVTKVFIRVSTIPPYAPEYIHVESFEAINCSTVAVYRTWVHVMKTLLAKQHVPRTLQSVLAQDFRLQCAAATQSMCASERTCSMASAVTPGLRRSGSLAGVASLCTAVTQMMKTRPRGSL